MATLTDLIGSPEFAARAIFDPRGGGRRRRVLFMEARADGQHLAREGPALLPWTGFKAQRRRF